MTYIGNTEAMLQHDHVLLALFVRHLLLQRRAQRIQQIAASLDGCLAVKQTDPSQTRDDALFLLA